MTINDIKNAIASIKDFPKNGIDFKDITPLFLKPDYIKFIIDQMESLLVNLDFDVIVAPESRGYLFGVPLSLKMNKPFVMIRKPNKLPREKISINYELEYGFNTLEMHKNDIKPNSKVLIVDDLLATGGTSMAIQEIVEKNGSNIVGQIYLININIVENLSKKLKGEIFWLINY